MKKFKYIAKDQLGKDVKGVLEAKSLDALQNLLNGKNLTVINLKEDIGLSLDRLNQINVGGVPISDKVFL
jgi:type II secretory pathway component PulF